MSTNSLPLVSVIIPAFNSGRFLPDAIRSVLSQTFSNFELILVNDGSNDSTEEIVDQFIKTDKRIKGLSQNNQGVSKARNNGYKNSSGQFIAFLDADDIWLSTNLEKKLEFLMLYPNIGLVHSDYSAIDNKGQQTGKLINGLSGRVTKELLLLEKTVVPGPSSVLIRREIIEKTGLFDPNLSTSADYDFFVRISEICEFGRIPEVTWCYRLHENNMSRNPSETEKDVKIIFKKPAVSSLLKKNKIFFRSKGNMNRMLAGLYWQEKGGKFKAVTFLLKSLFYYPIGLINFLREN